MLHVYQISTINLFIIKGKIEYFTENATTFFLWINKYVGL